MPELPEVETVRRGLAPAMVGATFTNIEQRRPDLRFPFPENFASRLANRRIDSLSRRAKYLLADLDDGMVLVMHLGMSGSFRVEAADAAGWNTPPLVNAPKPKLAAHDHVVFDFSNGARITYNDPRRFGFMLLIARSELAAHPLFRNVGIEPLGNELDGTLLASLFAGKTTPLKTALLDQTLIAGLGNIYVCEALHRAGLSPRRAAGTLVGKNGRPLERIHRLAQTIREVLEEAIEAGGSSLRDHRQADGALGYFQHNFRVYDQEGEPCRTQGCGGTIRRIVQNGRSTFYCPACQK
ncbi:bifunctional DNA-formamidopyrimidine glycosylase/DNA-(apurinic or apyrimidinic site) lyase [Beijerinckia mobilis]|uniref:bifunctional DNA-formamidopyrimidine glycosylase/DNA-(apurinic or apyrimidinic site) lyase n=1 Tax=Beijerinckia mobilis TaxID=231434 RepID=UPI000552B8FF|nr:bifunctional DNA-formamidopyrimidine glycosylase/DNA-(apurinic or apyrimidinic site) lyase [Beijerinckia mobilis]